MAGFSQGPPTTWEIVARPTQEAEVLAAWRARSCQMVKLPR